MAKVVRMSVHEFREWRENTPQLVRPDGSVARASTPIEEKMIDPLVQRARSSGHSLTATVLDKPLVVEMTRTGPQRDNYFIRVFYDSEIGEDGEPIVLERVSGRDVIRKHFVRKFGSDCQLRAPSGAILGVARDPSLLRPTFAESSRLAPKPEHCVCRVWGDPHPSTHHHACPYNQFAPHDEKGSAGTIATHLTTKPETPKGITMQVPGIERGTKALHQAAPSVSAPHVPILARHNQAPVPFAVTTNAPSIVAPEACPLCKEWAKPSNADPKKHHPICLHFEAWEAQSREPMSIVDLDTGKAVRPATQEEVAEAEVKKAKTGDSIITISGATYGVLPTKSLKRLSEALEAAGQPTAS